jgi:hypothetical protein
VTLKRSRLASLDLEAFRGFQLAGRISQFVLDRGRSLSYVVDGRVDATEVNVAGFVLTLARAMPSPRNARQAHGLGGNYTCSGRLAPGGVVRSILRFVFVVVPTAVLATAVVVGVSSNGRHAAVADGDLQRDLQLASTTSLELTPVGRPLATISAIEAPPSSKPERTTRPTRSRSGSRVIRSHAPTVTAAPEPEVAEVTDESATSEPTELASAEVEPTGEAPAPGGVALPRPTVIPVIFPTGGSDAGTYDPDPGSVIRGGSIDPDHCQIYGRGGRRPVYRQPRGISIADRIRGGQVGRERPMSLGDRIRAGQASNDSRRGSISDRIREGAGRSRSEGSNRGSMADRIRARR